ncbi:translation initiation factor IF-2-like [Schistocerca serialis cubense]|uniref:translation initiation factor IF-2-like n=1 Tax=Schistocerca serialis cubense TaxID=2023355 RepID=UPI00214E45DB|nr:translation initiation factor IF-2-like [Schistocerca serialis cubense]
MVLKKHVPSFVMIGGHRGVVQYNGQPQTCSICNSTEHMRANCPRNKRPAQLPRQPNTNAEQQDITGNYAGAVAGEAPRLNEEPVVAVAATEATAEAAAPTAATESPAAPPTPAAVPAPAVASAGSAGEKRQLSSDSEGEGTMECEVAAAPAPSPAIRRQKVAEVDAPVQEAAVASQTAGPSSNTPQTFSEMREANIKKSVNKIARMLKESDNERKDTNTERQKPTKPKRKGARRSHDNAERMETSDGESSDAPPAKTVTHTSKPEDVVLRPDRPQHTPDPPQQSARRPSL